jgi:hypothetical protein
VVAKLNQIIAVEKGVKNKSFQDLTEAHHAVQKPTLLSGISRVYQPKDEEGEQLPPESTRVQVKVEEILRDTASTITRLFDVTATKDWANCQARADVTVDGQPLLRAVPVTYLLFLEKQLTDLHTFIKKLPVLDAAETWTFDASADCCRATTSRPRRLSITRRRSRCTTKTSRWATGPRPSSPVPFRPGGCTSSPTGWRSCRRP